MGEVNGGRKKREANRPTAEQIAAMSDEEHWRVCEELVRGYTTRCLRMKMLLDDAEEAAAAYLGEVLEKQQEYLYNGYSRTRLWTIAGRAAHNDVADQLRNEERAEPMRRDYGQVSHESHGRANNPLRNIVDDEVAARVRLALATLSKKETQVFFLWYEEEIEGEGISYEAIAVRLNMPLATVRTHMQRARKKLREELQDVWDDRQYRDWWDHGAASVSMSGLRDPNDDPVDKRFDNKYDRVPPAERFYLRSGQEGEKKRQKKELEFERLKQERSR